MDEKLNPCKCGSEDVIIWRSKRDCSKHFTMAYAECQKCKSKSDVWGWPIGAIRDWNKKNPVIDQLLPCPKCGGVCYSQYHPQLKGHRIHCKECGLMSDNYDSYELAVSYWNSRPLEKKEEKLPDIAPHKCRNPFITPFLLKLHSKYLDDRWTVYCPGCYTSGRSAGNKNAAILLWNEEVCNGGN